MKIVINETSPVPIYEQIMNGIIRMIALGEFEEDGKLPSVRELAVFLKVNPNTVAHTFSELSGKGMIYSKRGLGNFISKGAKKKCLENVIRKVRTNISGEIKILSDIGLPAKEINKIINEVRRGK